MNINWHLVQKVVEALVIFGWEHWLSKTKVVSANSTAQLILDGLVKLFKKGDTNGPKV